MLGLSASSDLLCENTSETSEEDCVGLARVFENVDVNNSAEFLFKDTYFEDMENLEFVYDPILCLSSENLAPPTVLTTQKIQSHCPGCNCPQILETETFEQDPGKNNLLTLQNIFCDSMKIMILKNL